jgi:hypothetical protein
VTEAGDLTVERRRGRLRWLLLAALLLVTVAAADLWRRSTDIEAAVEAVGGQMIWDNKPNAAEKLMAGIMGMSDDSAVMLGLSETEVDDDWLRTHRRGMERIADRLELYVDATRVTDVGLGHLQDLENVNSLIVSGTAVTDAGLVHLQTLANLEELSIDHTHVTDDGLGKLSSCHELWFLGIDRSQATERGVAHLKNCRTLRWLTLRDATDETVARLADFTELERLYLDGAGITDASVPVLSGMTQLESIIFVDDSLSEAGLGSLKQALPGCMIERLKEEE